MFDPTEPEIEDLGFVKVEREFDMEVADRIIEVNRIKIEELQKEANGKKVHVRVNPIAFEQRLRPRVPGFSDLFSECYVVDVYVGGGAAGGAKKVEAV